MKRTVFILSILVLAFLASCEKDDYSPLSQEEIPEESNDAQLKSGGIYANYYPSSAVSYALTWTDNSGSLYDTTPYNNSQYRSYNPNDCANFVSQCLLAGGLYTDNTWYSNYLNWSPDAWINVEALHSYITGSAYSINTRVLSYSSSVTTYISTIYNGDLVFYYNYSLGKFDHVTLVTSKTSSDVFVSGHSANQKNHSLKTYLQNEKNHPYDYVVVLHFN